MSQTTLPLRADHPRAEQPYAAAPYTEATMRKIKRDNGAVPLVWASVLVFVPLYWVCILAYFIQIIF
jgi:hypothetical protein